MTKILLPILLIIFHFFLFLGNRSYTNEDYDSALNEFSQAAKLGIDSKGIAHNNEGTAYYQLEQYQDAIDSYLQALDEIEKSGKDEYKEMILYNLGNAYFRYGETLIEIDPEQTLDEWITAIEKYTEALDIDPDDTEAEENIEYILSIMKQLEEQAKQEQSDDEKETQDVNEKEIEEMEKQNKEDYNKYRDYYEDDEGDYDYNTPDW